MTRQCPWGTHGTLNLLSVFFMAGFRGFDFLIRPRLGRAPGDWKGARSVLTTSALLWLRAGECPTSVPQTRKRARLLHLTL